MAAKIAIGGKGGVGKTTVCAILAQLFADEGFKVLAVDADSDTNLGNAFGIAPGKLPEPLIGMKQLIGERTGTNKDAVGVYFKLNPKVGDLPEKYWLQVNQGAGFKLLVLGGIDKAGAGCACGEGAFLKAMLSHTILQRQEMVLVDMDAGVEFMGRASIQGVDVLIVVIEPGGRSIETANNIAKMAQQLGVRQVAAIANKITDTKQLETIKAKLSQDIYFLVAIDYDSDVQKADLEFRPVFESSSTVVAKLEEAKDKLMPFIGSVSIET